MAAEKNFERKVRQWLEDRGAWVLKTWSNGVQRVGVPDLLVCYKGVFMGIEIKAQNGKPSALQLHEIERIKNAGGFACVLYPSGFQEFKDDFEFFMDARDRAEWDVIWK